MNQYESLPDDFEAPVKNRASYLVKRNFLIALLVALVVGCLVLSVIFVRAAAEEGTQLLLINADIYTSDTAMPRATAMVFDDARIVEVGSTADLRRKYDKAAIIDAAGRTVMPGFTDAHAHLVGFGQADLMLAPSLAETVQRMVAYAAQHPDLGRDRWLLGRGWDQNLWGTGGEFPTKHDLDVAFPEIPVWVTRVDGHAKWANSAALRFAVIPDTDPEGGQIIRDENGEPTGVFIDTAMEYVDNHVPPPTRAFLKEALNLAVHRLHSLGITGVHDMGVGYDIIDLLKDAADENRLDLRVYASLSCPDGVFCANRPLELKPYRDRLVLRSAKISMDGALGSWGAAMLRPYSDNPNVTGLLRMEEAQYTALAQQWVDAGYQLNTHAIGDRANRVVINGLEQVISRAAGADLRLRIEHAQIVSLEDIPRMVRLGIIPSFQPTHCTSDMSYVPSRLGNESESDRILGAYAWQRFSEAGSQHLPLGSDFPVELPTPFAGVYAAITRQDAEGLPAGGFFPSQRLTRAQTLKGFTYDAAYASFQEESQGSLSSGKLADFIVLDRNIWSPSLPARDILDTRVMATYFGGTCVYSDADAPASLCRTPH